MTRETKQDRTAKSIFDPMNELFHELQNTEKNPNNKEAEVEVWAQSFLKNALGFNVISGYSIRTQETKGRMRPDLTVYKDNAAVLVVEVKKLGFDFSKSDFRSGKMQLSEYLNQSGKVRWGMLTNGYEFVLYDFSYETNTCVEVVHIDLRGDEDKLEVSKKAVDEASWDALELHESAFKSGEWEDLSREATAFSPESLARAILSSSVVKFISREIKGEHELKVNPEILTTRLFDLLENGLDDSIPGWCDAKRDELSKYTRAQLRASRRVRKKAKAVAVEVAALTPDAAAPNEVTPVVPDKKVA